MKEYVSLTTAPMKMGKYTFTVIIVTVASLGNSMINHPGHITLTSSGRYHRDMKLLKILASDFKEFRLYGIFKKWQIDDDRGGG